MSVAVPCGGADDGDVEGHWCRGGRLSASRSLCLCRYAFRLLVRSSLRAATVDSAAVPHARETCQVSSQKGPLLRPLTVPAYSHGLLQPLLYVAIEDRLELRGRACVGTRRSVTVGGRTGSACAERCRRHHGSGPQVEVIGADRPYSRSARVPSRHLPGSTREASASLQDSHFKRFIGQCNTFTQVNQSNRPKCLIWLVIFVCVVLLELTVYTLSVPVFRVRWLVTNT